MKRTILMAVLGLLAMQLMTACNRSEETSSTSQQSTTNGVTTNAPATATTTH